MRTSLSGSKRRTVVRYTERGGVRDEDVLAEEEPLEIALLHRGRRRVVAITMRTPGRDLDLALGFLFSEGLLPPGLPVGGGAQVQGNVLELPWPDGLPLSLQGLERNSYTSSSCGVCGKTSLELVYRALPFPDAVARRPVAVRLLYRLPDRLRGAQELFETTGGIHAAGLFDRAGELLHVAEDVGRHNALDKLVGHSYRQRALPLDDHILVLSGRASFELLQKAAMAGIGIVVSVGAPSTLAAELAEDQGITLCGFVRRDRLNCYAHPDRLRVDPPGPDG